MADLHEQPEYGLILTVARIDAFMAVIAAAAVPDPIQKTHRRRPPARLRGMRWRRRRGGQSG